MNISNLLDNINTANDSYQAYAYESAQYRARHGHGVYFDGRRLDPEEMHIGYLYHDNERESTKMYGIFEVLDFDREQIVRSYIAARAIRRWYNATNWERPPSDELLERLKSFVVG